MPMVPFVTIRTISTSFVLRRDLPNIVFNPKLFLRAGLIGHDSSTRIHVSVLPKVFTFDESYLVVDWKFLEPWQDFCEHNEFFNGLLYGGHHVRDHLPPAVNIYPRLLVYPEVVLPGNRLHQTKHFLLYLALLLSK